MSKQYPELPLCATYNDNAIVYRKQKNKKIISYEHFPFNRNDPASKQAAIAAAKLHSDKIEAITTHHKRFVVSGRGTHDDLLGVYLRKAKDYREWRVTVNVIVNDKPKLIQFGFSENAFGEQAVALAVRVRATTRWALLMHPEERDDIITAFVALRNAKNEVSRYCQKASSAAVFEACAMMRKKIDMYYRELLRSDPPEGDRGYRNLLTQSPPMFMEK